MAPFPSQVHACNVLRALYRDTKLGEAVFPFVSEGVIVAIDGFLSESWAVSTHLCCHQTTFLMLLFDNILIFTVVILMIDLHRYGTRRQCCLVHW